MSERFIEVSSLNVNRLTSYYLSTFIMKLRYCNKKITLQLYKIDVTKLTNP